MTKDEIFDAITLEQMDGGYQFSPEKLTAFLEKLWNKPCECDPIVIEGHERWKPAMGDKYLYIWITRTEGATVNQVERSNSYWDKEVYDLNNCYPLSARTEVQKRCDEINAIIKKGI